MRTRVVPLGSDVLLALFVGVACRGTQRPSDGRVLPFPPEPMAGVAAPRLQDSSMRGPEQVRHLPADAPNMLLIRLHTVRP